MTKDLIGAFDLNTAFGREQQDSRLRHVIVGGPDEDLLGNVEALLDEYGIHREAMHLHVQQFLCQLPGFIRRAAKLDRPGFHAPARRDLRFQDEGLLCKGTGRHLIRRPGDLALWNEQTGLF